MNKNIMTAMGFGAEVEAVEQRKCPFCKKDIIDADFKDALSRRESEISGLCQKCQDEFFGE